MNSIPYFGSGGIAIDDLTGRVDVRISDGEDVSFLVRICILTIIISDK